MLARMVLVSLCVACSSDAKPPAPLPAAAPPLPALEPWMQTTLACVTRSAVAHLDASEAAADVALAAFTTRLARPYRHVRHWIAAFTAATIERPVPSPRVPADDLLALAAVAHAELGDLRTARALATRALAAPPPRDPGVARALEVLAWSGDGARARTLAGDDPYERALVAGGLARGGDVAGARALLATLVTDDPGVRGAIVMAHVYAGDLDAARALIATEPDPDHRASLYVWAADALVPATVPGGVAFLDDALAAVGPRAEADVTPGPSIAEMVWSDLVKARDQLDGDRAARARLHAWLLDPAHTADRLDLIAGNVVRAEVAGMPADADRLLARLPPAYLGRASLDLALLRARFASAFTLLAPHLTERAALRGQPSALPDVIVGGIDAVEADLWLAFTDAPRDPALIAAFERLVCR